MTYEIMKPETIGLSKNNLVFDKFKHLANRKKSILDEDIEALINEGIQRSSDVFKLEYLHVSSGTNVFPSASVHLKIHNRLVKGATEGNGPIDAIFDTISKLTNTRSQLLRFSISALTEGQDA